MLARLPTFLKFKSAEDLIRVGRSNDGGYLVSAADVVQADGLISVGMADDWSFEADFLKKNMVRLVIYDGSVSYRYFVLQILKKIAKFSSTREILSAVSCFISYMTFFNENDRRHVSRHVGLIDGTTSVSLSSAISSIDRKSIFLKIDAEGSEYRMLDDLLQNANFLTGAVIEFHDVDLHLSRIQEFVRAFPLSIAHVHANNAAPVAGQDLIPTVLEITFTRHARITTACYMPHPLDMPNVEDRIEISWGV